MDMTVLNSKKKEEFIEVLSGIYESSPWVAERAWDSFPFTDLDTLKTTMRQTVNHASVEKKTALIMAHPDLGGKLGMKRELTAESQKEQASLGLDALDPEEFHEFTHLNTTYKEKFGFPFIICVGLTKSRAEILESFRKRIHLTEEEEQAQALDQIHKIAELRLDQLVEVPHVS